MNFKTTIVLLILLAGAGTYVAVQQFRGKNNEAATASETNKLVDARADDVSKISVTSSDGKKLVLVRKGKDWQMTEPMTARADTFAVEDLLRQLTGLTSRGQLKADQKSSVGLDSPKFVVEVTANNKTTKLSFGDQNKIGDSLYVLAGDKPEPQIVATTISDQLNKAPTDYRSKKLTDLSLDNTSRINQLSITQNGKTIRLDKQNGEWEITEPKKMPADSGAVSSLLSSISDLNATDFVSSPSAPATYGLTKPVLTVSYTATGTPPATQPASHQIAFGRFATIERNEVYASVDGGPVATVSNTTTDAFKKTALDLRDKKVVDIDPAHVTSFTLSVNKAATTQPTTQPAEQHEYTIARRKEAAKAFGPQLPSAPEAKPSTQAATTEPTTKPAVAETQPASKWVFESGASGPASETEVDNLLNALHPLQATKFVEKSPTTQPAAGYALTVHVGPANGKGPQDIVLHFTSPGATGDVIGTYEDLTFETDRSILEKLDARFAGR